MEIVQSGTGADPRLALHGELDIAGVDEVERYVAAIAAGAPRDLVLDLTGLAFIDSTGLSCLLNVHDTTRAEGIRLWILYGEGAVARALRLTGLHNVLPLVVHEPDVSADGSHLTTSTAA